jgi:hypothetical protein
VSRWLLLVLAIPACGGSPTPGVPDPSCTPGGPDVELVTAPADRDFPECVEIPAHSERGSTARAWCCWKGEVRP